MVTFQNPISCCQFHGAVNARLAEKLGNRNDQYKEQTNLFTPTCSIIKHGNMKMIVIVIIWITIQ